MRWAREWAKEGVAVDWEHPWPPEGFQVLPRRWVVERTIAWIDRNRRMSKDYERLCASGEALCICCDDSPHDEAVDPPLRPFHTAS
jgi:transposase